jgi:hypothetical protein
MIDKTISLDIRIICVHPPDSLYSGKPAEFGVQDKAGNLTAGRLLPDGTLAFDVNVTISDDDPPKFGGKHAHGTSTDRFVYLSYRYSEEPTVWIKRIKIPLNSITAGMARTIKNAPLMKTLATYVNGQLAARVDAVWKIVER